MHKRAYHYKKGSTESHYKRLRKVNIKVVRNCIQLVLQIRAILSYIRKRERVHKKAYHYNRERVLLGVAKVAKSQPRKGPMIVIFPKQTKM